MDIMFAARVLSAFVAFTAFVYFLSFSSLPAGTLSASSEARTSQTDEQGTLANKLRLHGTYRKAEDGTRLVFQRSPEDMSKGTVVFLHGCRHSAFDFFPRGDQCVDCIGLPEEVRMVRQVLHRGYSAVAISSTSGACWQTNEDAATGEDYTRVETALKVITDEDVHTNSIPLFVVGISSGGRFATSLTPRFPISAVNSIISASVISSRPDHDPPPHAFTHMHTRDPRTVKAIARDVEDLKNRGISVLEFRVPPRAVTANLLQAAIPDLQASVASAIVSSLKEHKFIDADGHVSANPRKSDWRSAVLHLADKMSDRLVADESALSEELNRAYGGHEITSDYFNDVLDFFDENRAIPSSDN